MRQETHSQPAVYVNPHIASNPLYRARKNKWAIAPELHTRSLWAPLRVFDTSRRVNTGLSDDDRVMCSILLQNGVKPLLRPLHMAAGLLETVLGS